MNDLSLAKASRSSRISTLAAFLIFAATLANAGEVASGLEGKWSGKVQIPGHELILIVDLARGENWSGSATLPGLNLKGAPLTDVRVNGDEVSFAIQGMIGPAIDPPKIKARFTDKKLAGDFLQAGNSARLTLEKLGPPQVEPPPLSTPVAKQFEGEWKGGYELLGYPRKVTLKLQNHSPAPATAEWVIEGRKVNNVPVDRISQQGDFITIESSVFGIAYEGRFQDGEIHGTVLQGPIEVGLVLRRPN